MIVLHTIYFGCKITSYTVSEKGVSEKSVATIELSLIFLLTSLFFTGFTMLTPILPLYITDLGASKLELGFIMATLPATSIFARFPFSVLSIKIGRWPVAISALLLQLTSCILFMSISTKILLYPTIVIYALALSSFGPSAIAIALESSPIGRKGMIMGRFYGAIGVGMIVGPLLTSLLTYYLEVQQIFLFALALPITGLTIFILFGSKSLLKKSNEKKLPEEKGTRSLLYSIRRIVCQRNIILLSASSITFFIALGAFETIFPVYAKGELGLMSYQISLLFVARGIPNAISRIPIGNLSDKIGRRIPLVFAYGLSWFALFLISVTNNVLLLIPIIGLYGLAWGARTAPSAALYSDNTLPQDTALVSTILWLTADIALAFGSSLAGTLSLFIPTQSIFRVVSMIVLAGLFGVLLINESKSQRRR
jgi:MFS family permease